MRSIQRKKNKPCDQMDERKVAVTCDNYYANGILLIEIAQRMHATNRFASDGHTEKKKIR